jgi:hypothetical protein
MNLFDSNRSGGAGDLAMDAAHVFWSLNFIDSTPHEYALGTPFKTPVEPGASEPWVRLGLCLLGGIRTLEWRRWARLEGPKVVVTSEPLIPS